MLIFAKVVELGSFSKAALHLGLAKSSVSKKVSALEQELGVRLLQRTTRSLHITEEGQTLFERCLRIQRELEVAKEEVAGFRDKPQGKLRISASPLFGQLRLAPLLPEFLTRYPEITIDLQLSVDQSDLIAEGYDLAIRFGELPDSSLIAKRLTSVRPICCASQSYLETHGHPHTPADLKQHNCISWQPPDRPRVTHWEFSKGSKKHRIPFRGNFVSNDFLAIKTAVLCGGGITLLPSYLLHEEMEQGTLQELLPEYPMPEVPVYLLYPQRRRLPAKVRTFISFLHAAGI
jgi:DNA-binding transcriptional LysR family regulator